MLLGIDKLLYDLAELGYNNLQKAKDTNGLDYAIIKDFEIQLGSFAGKLIDLAIPAYTDYPRSFGSSMHTKADPHLVPFENLPNRRNVVPSLLGDQWQYWSFGFRVKPTNPTSELISQINEIFRKN